MYRLHDWLFHYSVILYVGEMLNSRFCLARKAKRIIVKQKKNFDVQKETISISIHDTVSEEFQS